MEHIKELKNYPVVKSNKLIEAKYKLTLNEVRLVYTVISLIKPEDEEFKKYCIKIKDILQMFEITTNIYHERIKRFFIDLAKKPIVIQSENKDFVVANWFASSEYISVKGVIEIELSQKLKPYLLQLKSHFTTYGLDSILKLKSTYSIRLYEILLKEYCYYSKQRNNFIFSIKELKSILGLEKNEYPFFNNFKSRVLDIANKELKEKSDFYFEYKTIKTGRAITDIEFFVINKEKKEDKKQKQLTQKKDSKEIIDVNQNHSPVEEQETYEIIKRLIELGFQDYKKIRSEHSDEVLLDAFADLDFEIEDRKKKKKESLNNVGAWVRKRLPIAGQPFQRSLHHNKYLEEQDKKKQQEEIKQQEQLKAKIEREKRENFIKELDEKVNQKIEDLKLNYPDEWEAVEKEVRDKVNAELQPPKQDKEEREFIKSIISELTENDKNMLGAAAIEKAKTNLIGLGLSEDSKNFNNILKSVKQTTFELIVKEKYLLEIESLLKETKYYKAYEQRLIIESNRIRRGIIIKKLKDDI